MNQAPKDTSGAGPETFLLEEYGKLSDAFLSNEELGERRLNFFVSLTTAVIAALAALWGSDVIEVHPAFVLIPLSVLFLFGLVTLLRLIQRNITTDEYLNALSRIRMYFVRQRPEMLKYLSYPVSDIKFRDKPFKKGGLVPMVSLINSAIITALAIISLYCLILDQPFILAIYGLAVYVLAFYFHFWYVKKRYEDAEREIRKDSRFPPGEINIMNGSSPPRKEKMGTFRANAGIVVLDREGQVLALERSDHPGAWQMPQGGIRENERPRDAADRELKEETGLTKDQVVFISEYPDWMTYALPEDKRTAKHGMGQAQKWFIFRFTGNDSDIQLKSSEFPEFRSWQWMPLEDLAEKTIEFRRNIYRELARYCKEL